MLENEQPGYQPGRQRRLPRSQPTHRAEPSRQKVPIDRPRQPHQRMAKVDDLLEKRAKQVVLAIVARLAHRSPPTANLAVEGITDHPNGESQTAIKPACTPGFLAKSIPCSGQIIAINQSLPNSSRTTTYVRANSAASPSVRTVTSRARRRDGLNPKSIMPRKLARHNRDACGQGPRWWPNYQAPLGNR